MLVPTFERALGDFTIEFHPGAGVDAATKMVSTECGCAATCASSGAVTSFSFGDEMMTVALSAPTPGDFDVCSGTEKIARVLVSSTLCGG